MRSETTLMIHGARWPCSAYGVDDDNQYCSKNTDIGTVPDVARYSKGVPKVHFL